VAKLRTIFRRLRTLLWTALTLVIILSAIMVGIGKLLMPYSVRYQPQLEAWLTREFQQPVVVDSFTGEWKAFGPRISLEGVTLLGDGQREGEIAIQHAALDIKPLNVLLPNRPLYSFRIIGADMALERTLDGRYELSGLGVSGRSNGDSDGSQLKLLDTVGEIRLEDSSLSFNDQERGIHLQLTGMQGRLQLNGTRLSTELEADISDDLKTRVLGDLKATLLITLSDQQRLSELEWHIKSGELMLQELARQLPYHTLIPRSGWLNAEIWGSWSKGQRQVMEGVVDLRESTLSERPRLLQLDHLNTRFRWNFDHRKVWRIDLSDLTIEQDGREWQTPHMSIERNIPGNLGLWVSSDFVDMEFPMQLTQRIMSSYDTRWPRQMPRQARGLLHDFDLVLDSRWKLFMVEGEMEMIDAWEWDRYPDVAGISGTLSLLGGEGELRFSGEDVRIDWPRNFRRQAVVDIPACTMEILWGKAWRIDARDCVIEHEHFALSGRSRFGGNTGKPEMDINVLIDRANLAELDDYWPQSVMSEKVSDWLRRGIVSGEAVNGRFMLRGDMDDWPFRGHEGVLLARANVGKASLDYMPAWPRAENIELQAHFRDTAMRATGSAGSIGGVPVQQVTAEIADFKQPELVLDYNGQAPMPDLLRFIERTPLLDDVDLDLDPFRFEALASTSGRLISPLRSGQGEVVIDGRLVLEGNRFTELNSGIELNDLAGEIRYDREGMRGSDLTGSYRGHDAGLSLVADWDGLEVFSTQLTGAFPIEELLPEPLLETEPMLSRFSGTSEWVIDLSVSSDIEAAERETWLDLRSGLEGVSVDFPVPLDKPPQERWDVHVRYPVKAAQPVMSIRLNEKATLQFEQGGALGKPQRAHIQFGAEAGELPADGFFSLGGTAPRFDLDEWMDLVIERFTESREEQGLLFDHGRLFTEDLLFLNRSFPNVDLSVQYEDGVLKGAVDSELLAGTVRYSRSDDGSHSLAAELDRLLMPKPIDEGMTMDTDPSTLPEMHLYAREFRYMGLDLGETRIEAFPIQNGLRIDSVESVSSQMNFQARGDWIRDDKGSRSDFDIMMTSESIGSLMELMDISSVLEGGQTILRYDAWWPGPPAAFELALLNGEMTISVVDGRILNADAGAGRVVGLLSVAALPRRLALDFRDVFESGFSFEQAAGTVTLENGTAHTNDLVLDSTAAVMEINGHSDLVNQEFDYVMAVRPGVGQALPALGAVIGGPGGAAAGLALQGLLQKSLGDATEARYTITGPWSSPVVTPVRSAQPAPETAEGAEQETAIDESVDTAVDDPEATPEEQNNDDGSI
jgi:uncharacterized protein (TIGR02099 family)